MAIETGFHSLVQVLLQGGAAVTGGGHRDPIYAALRMRRTDLVELLVEHGYDAREIDMRAVFDTWDPDLMEYFIDRGADVETDRPLAYALCSRIQTALRVLKRYRDRFASFPEQANVALRHHCKEGNMKWIPLMLWAGADPHAPGASNWDEEPDPDDGYSALAYAALYGHHEVFGLRQVRLDPKHPSMRVVAQWCCDAKGLEILKKLLEGGLEVNDQPNGGSSILHHTLTKFDWEVRFGRRPWDTERRGIDTHETRELMEVVHLLSEHGARWEPEGRYQINAVRRALLAVTPEYSVEFVGLMAHHRLCTRESLMALLRPQSMKVHLERYSERVCKLLAQLPHAATG